MRRLSPLSLLVLTVLLISGSAVLSSWARSDPHGGAYINRAHLPDADVVDSQPQPLCGRQLAQACEFARVKWLKTLGTGFQSIQRGPFVIVGNISEAELSDIYAGTVHPSVEAMCREYFSARLTEPVSILLFHDELTYRRFAFFSNPGARHSIYGYYQPSTRTVVVNLAAGTGTIVHELTHALMDFDYPDAPLWINEGIASMYEECQVERTDEGYELRPLDNWRLPILQTAIRADVFCSIRRLMERDFSGVDEAQCYAEARYLCLYLHEAGILADVYRNMRDDPNGAENGVAILERTRQLGKLAAQQNLDVAFRAWAVQRDASAIASQRLR